VISKWCIVSGFWSHKTHRWQCCRRRRCNLSAVQYMFLFASHKNLTWGGTQHFQISFQALQAIDPWKDAR
jgi:hypothetical protein